MTNVAIIGGTGLARMEGLNITRREMVKTPYGAPSCPLLFGELDGRSVVFLARHGSTHRIPPHRINYCANIWALHDAGVGRIVAVGAVGGIAAECHTGSIVIPDQIIDYTYDRTNTFFDGDTGEVRHIDFSFPYDGAIRQALIAGAIEAGLTPVESGTYGAMQGPRLETAAEINRMERDGCTIVGMTGMPEACLARELDMAYACCGVVVNPAAGHQPDADDIIEEEALNQAVKSGMFNARTVISRALAHLV